eukprot:m.229577 g.229577  ORF g.229577 m.229577 type:complete len:427 (+) comp11924_c0_seq1:91-1371(+)
MSEASLAAKVLLDSFSNAIPQANAEALQAASFEADGGMPRIHMEATPNFPVVYGPQNTQDSISIHVGRPDQNIISQLGQLRESFGHLFPEQMPVPKRNRESAETWSQETMDEFSARAKMWQNAVEKASNGTMRVSFNDNPNGIPEVRTRCDACGDVIRTRARFFVRDAVFDHLVSSKHVSNVTTPRPAPPIVEPAPAAAATFNSTVPHDGPCSAICLGFGYRDNLVRGPDYRNKEKRLLFVIDPEFRGRRCPCNGGQAAEDGSAFGRSEFQCLGVAHNPSGVCDGCERASKLHVARQRRYYRCNRLDVCGRRANARKRKHDGSETTRTRRTNAPAGSEAARRHAPGYVLGSIRHNGDGPDLKPLIGQGGVELGPQPQADVSAATAAVVAAAAAEAAAEADAAAAQPAVQGPHMPADASVEHGPMQA